MLQPYFVSKGYMATYDYKYLAMPTLQPCLRFKRLFGLTCLSCSYSPLHPPPPQSPIRNPHTHEYKSSIFITSNVDLWKSTLREEAQLHE